jgi:hypothetical protein
LAQEQCAEGSLRDLAGDVGDEEDEHEDAGECRTDRERFGGAARLTEGLDGRRGL